MDLRIPTPLNGLRSPYSQENEEMLQQLGHVLGFFLECKVKDGNQALALLHFLRNNAAADQNLKTAFLCENLAFGLLQTLSVGAEELGGEPVKKSKPVAKSGARSKKLRLVD